MRVLLIERKENMRTLVIIAVLTQAGLAQLPLTGPISLESKGSLAPLQSASVRPSPLPPYFYSQLVPGGLTDTEVAFCTNLPLEPADTNNVEDIYVRNFVLGTTTLVSTAPSGAAGTGRSWSPRIAGDGSGVVFTTSAENLSPGAKTDQQIMYRDLQTGLTELISVGLVGGSGNGPSFAADVSEDGRFVVFSSLATNLVPGDTEGFEDVFLRDRVTGITTRVSELANGSGGTWHSNQPRIAGNGSSIVFRTQATNLNTGASTMFPASSDPIWIVKDLTSQTLERVGIGNTGFIPNGSYGNAAISADGRFVAFHASNALISGALGSSIYVRDRLAARTEVVSVTSSGASTSWALYPEFSGNGRFIVFRSRATNLVPNQTSDGPAPFLHDRLTGTTIHLSLNANGAQPDSYGTLPHISPSGRFVAFISIASNMVPKPVCARCTELIVVDLGPQANLGGASGAGRYRPYARVVEPSAGAPWVLSLIDAPASSPTLLALRTGTGTPIPFGIGALISWPPDLLLPLKTTPQGQLAFPFDWPVSAPAGMQLVAQWGVADPQAPMGIALSNALSVLRP